MKASSIWIAAFLVTTPVAAQKSGIVEDETSRIPITVEKPLLADQSSDIFVAVTEAPQFQELRSDIAVPLPEPTSSHDIINRLYADIRAGPGLTSQVNVALSARLNWIQPISGGYGDNHLRLDLREAFVSWSAGGGVIAEAGRINDRTGVAVAYNVTDFFRERTVVDIVSVDPSVLRFNRLGTLMGRLAVASGPGAVTLTAVPRLAESEKITTPGRSFADLRLGRTNAHYAGELRGSLDLADGTSLQVSTYLREGRSPSFGFDAVRGVGEKMTVYVEAALQRSASYFSEAVQDGVALGELPSAAAMLLAGKSSQYRGSVAIGLTYATADRVTMTVEYDHDGAGLNRQEWSDVTERVLKAPSDLLGRGTFWYARSLIQQRQQLVTRGQVFARAGWDDAFNRKGLALAALILVATIDRSVLAQSSADYKLGKTWSIGGLVQLNRGSRQSIFGGSPQSVGLQIYATKYF